MNIPEPPERDPRQRRHSIETVQLARQMYGDGDSWTPHQIAMYLTDNGTPVHHSTVRRWVIPGLADEQRRQNVESWRRRVNKPRENPDEVEARIAQRMTELRDAGLSHSDVARVIALDMGREFGREQVAYRIACWREGKLVRNYERSAA